MTAHRSRFSSLHWSSRFATAVGIVALSFSASSAPAPAHTCAKHIVLSSPVSATHSAIAASEHATLSVVLAAPAALPSAAPSGSDATREAHTARRTATFGRAGNNMAAGGRGGLLSALWAGAGMNVVAGVGCKERGVLYLRSCILFGIKMQLVETTVNERNRHVHTAGSTRDGSVQDRGGAATILPASSLYERKRNDAGRPEGNTSSPPTPCLSCPPPFSYSWYECEIVRQGMLSTSSRSRVCAALRRHTWLWR
ncbi:hypothetical protein GGS23DRAFT_582137 [Durotheca rogersii]|uniref:uncharacterized protein n=1 Tax=Durotheca rogersii TaxID=419775 RepID=UPI002220020B|nr:uncharacterized protein GGS23DRAFT_582137 [Durotheca rogersii]KAI5860318.1 hypothetical protein GGS23DRAFT_582137 [Durotheca rogersii]